MLFASEGAKLQGRAIHRLTGWQIGDTIAADSNWTIDNIAAQLEAARL